MREQEEKKRGSVKYVLFLSVRVPSKAYSLVGKSSACQIEYRRSTCAWWNQKSGSPGEVKRSLSMPEMKEWPARCGPPKKEGWKAWMPES